MKRVKTVLLLLVLFMSFAMAHAQEKRGVAETPGKITGKVSDSSAASPLEYATISLYLKGASRPADGTTTNNTGHFQLTNVAPGVYTIVVEFIGYRASTIDGVTVDDKNPLVDLKTIRLAKKQESLQTVVVTAQGKIIENKIDKLVFNAERDITSQTGAATDVLKKVPQVSVDPDGNVELAGSSSIRFLIDGKPSSAFGSSIADVLQSIPASQIKSIEVITNPGAKYDAQGLGGIINIILKKSTARGVNGSLSLSGGTRMDNGSFNFNARKDKIAFNAFFSGNLRPYSHVPYTYQRNSDDAQGKTVQLLQNADNRFRRGGFQTGIGMDYTIDEKNSLTGSLSYDHFGNNGSGIVNQSQTVFDAATGTRVQSINTVNNATGKSDFHSIDAAVSYKKTFDKEDRELDIQANTSIGANDGLTSNLQYYLPQDSLYYGTYGTNPGKERETEVSVDYTQPLKKEVILGMGGKLNFRDIESNSNVLSYNPVSKSFVPDNYLTNFLTYHEKVYALYSELTLPVEKLFDAKIGARYERTNINSYYSNAAQKLTIPGYNTLVPSVSLSKKLGEHQLLKLSYSKRIERPDFRDLNPFVNTSDAKNITAGNPYLKPEIGNRIEFDYSIDFGTTGSAMVSTFYRTSSHDIQSYLVYYPSLMVGDSTFTDVSVSTRENIGIEKDAGLNLSGDVRLFTKLSLRGNFFIFRRHTLNAINKGLDATSVNFKTNINMSYQFNGALSAEFFGSFNSSRREVQGTLPSFTSYSFAVRQQLWNKKGSIALTATNPFSEYLDQKTVLKGPNFTSTGIRSIPFRSFGINFAWKFGKLEFKKTKEETNPGMSAPND